MNEEEIKEAWELENLVDIKYHLEKWKNESEKGELDECHLVEEDIEIMELAVNIIEKQQKEIEELKETLKATQNSWFEDTKKIEELKKYEQYYEEQNEVNAKFVPKQKIQDKIDNLKESLNTVEHYETVGAIKNLQELLESEE